MSRKTLASVPAAGVLEPDDHLHRETDPSMHPLSVPTARTIGYRTMLCIAQELYESYAISAHRRPVGNLGLYA